MDVHVRSLLRKKDGSFTPVREWEGKLGRSDYLEGALELTVNGVPLITDQIWDYIDELWVYILDSLENLASKGSAFTYFPDQPIKLDMNRISPSLILMSISSKSGKFNNSIQIQEEGFVRNLIDEGENFFVRMQELDPANQDQYEIEVGRFKEIRSAYSK